MGDPKEYLVENIEKMSVEEFTKVVFDRINEVQVTGIIVLIQNSIGGNKTGISMYPWGSLTTTILKETYSNVIADMNEMNERDYEESRDKTN